MNQLPHARVVRHRPRQTCHLLLLAYFLGLLFQSLLALLKTFLQPSLPTPLRGLRRLPLPPLPETRASQNYFNQPPSLHQPTLLRSST